MENKLDYVGQRIPRKDGPVKVAGRAKYTVDVQLPGMLVRREIARRLRRAGQVGWRRKPSQTPYEYQESLAEEAPASEADVAVLTQAFVEARYDVREFSPEEAQIVKQAWQRVRKLLRRAKRDRDKPESSDQADTD